MKFSVVVPAHNSAAFIDKLLTSIKDQTFTDYECIVVADDCVDNTAYVASQYGFKVIKTDVQNDGLARNVGIDNSIGDWILFSDSDDWLLHEYVFQQLADRITEVNSDIIAFDIVWKHIGVVGPVSGRNNELYPHCTNKCWKRSFIGDTRFPNIKPDSDAVFHNLMMQKNPKLDIWDMPLYYYNFLREGSFSQMLGRTPQMAIDWWGIK